MRINERGFWENSTAEGHGHDIGLGDALVKFFNKERASDIVDMGCGDGFYTKLLSANGFFCIGVDGNPNTPELVGRACYVLDLSKPQHLGGRFDWVLSLEVGEHIPAEFEQNFIQNLDRHNIKGIILSWAVRGQGGDGHVNCLNNDEVVKKIEPLGYKLDEEGTVNLRMNCAEYPNTGWWFRNTLLLFRRKK